MFARRALQSVSRTAARAMSTRGAAVAAKSKTPLMVVAGITAATAMAFAAPTELKAAPRVSPYTGVPGTKHERTFIAIKPDGVERGLISEVIARFEKKGYKLVAMKMMTATEARARDHYADLSSKPFFGGLVKYFASGPIVCMVWEGNDVILTGRKILGATNPNQAAPGTLRGDNCISTGRNLVHGSDGPDSAKHEIGMWFTQAEINDYARSIDEWVVSDN
ncbi:nucleoside diphosphate kinase B [Thraustotheca clavata]|uniref:Nucleoside diphosphate kinase n=1 Tax=Thraustotheca clavata TaxID=74557 RepID=A0A1W0ABA6_9STRA|nr:nucleoside diphosphate kinase B [Thraustotheca clavata]